MISVISLEAFQNFVQLCENKFDHLIKALGVDNETEYINMYFNDKKGIQLKTMAPYTPQHTGKSERDRRTIVKSARSMIILKNCFCTYGQKL